MKALVRKCSQDRGATFVFSLVVFLIATIISMTLVNGALTSAENAGDLRESQQEFLSVSSAAQLFRAAVESRPLVKPVYYDPSRKLLSGEPEEWSSITLSTFSRKTYHSWQREDGFHANGKEAASPAHENDGAEKCDGEAIYQALIALSDNTISDSAGTYSEELTISASTGEGTEGESIGDVHVVLKDMDGNFNFTAVLTSVANEEAAASMTIHFRGDAWGDPREDWDEYKKEEEETRIDPLTGEETKETKTVTAGYRQMYHLSWSAVTIG